MNGGECLCCERISKCTEVDVSKVLSSYTCALFKPVPEPVLMARLDAMTRFGEVSAAEGMINRPPLPEGDMPE